ncbi:hypothetical protein IDH16_00445 [Pelagibacterales bacterium SAG-MED45]|nr:hypothetical protein [Pelagibacterales bacterium SAG-MED45]
MYKNSKIILVAFYSLDLKKSADRLKKQAVNSNYYDEIRIFNPKDFDNKMIYKYNELRKRKKNRGFGYWFWKPLFLKKILNEINTNDIIHYVDIGCYLQNKNNRFYQYLDLLISQDLWILPFQYHLENLIYNDNINFEKREEFKYTKSDLFDYFDCLKNNNITDTPQYWSGSFFLRKKNKTSFFLNDWIEVFEKRFDLIDDTKSKLKNFDGFLENRHDQSVFQYYVKKIILDLYLLTNVNGVKKIILDAGTIITKTLYLPREI